MDCTNFEEFIKDSDNKDAEYHGWRLMPAAELDEEAAGISS
jgi:hypothetical protein